MARIVRDPKVDHDRQIVTIFRGMEADEPLELSFYEVSRAAHALREHCLGVLPPEIPHIGRATGGTGPVGSAPIRSDAHGARGSGE